MKFMVVVLAAVAAVQAAPEADPSLLYSGLSGYNFPYLGYNNFAYNNLALNNLAYNNLAINNIAPLAPIARTVAVAENIPAVASVAVAQAPIAVAPAPVAIESPIVRAIAPQPIVRAVAPVAPLYTPRDCASPAGCNARYLKDLGLARKKRESEADADAEAALLTSAYAGLYNPLLAYNNFPYSYNYPYAGLRAAVAPIASPIVRAVATPAAIAAEVAPAPVVQVAAPAPVAVAPQQIVRTIAAPAPVAVAPQPIVRAIAAPAPAVAVRAPIAQPIVASRTKKVTYTHLGAHPVSPTTVLETENAVVGHTLI